MSVFDRTKNLEERLGIRKVVSETVFRFTFF